MEDRMTPPLVLIEWEDSCQRYGWTRDPVEPAKPLVCHSVGWLVSSTKAAKTITANISVEDEGQRCGDMTIPNKAIISIRKLKPATK